MFIGLHNHTDYSNLRLRDALNTVPGILKYSCELGHKGIAITEHETIASSIKALKTLKEFKEVDPEKWKDYKLILGNEIYLCHRPEDGKKPDTFPHFILLAKDAIGHQQLRELSTEAWLNNSFMYVMMRVPTYYDNLIEIIGSNPGHVIGGSSCLGGSLPRFILQANEENPDNPDLSKAKKWIEKMIEIFGEGNFYLEMQPSLNEQQILVNKTLLQLSKELNILYVITTDSHYERKEDKKIHEAFLNSQDGDREVSAFYASTYVMSEEEIHKYMDDSIGVDAVQKGIDNSVLIADMCEEYELEKPLDIPYIPSNIAEPSVELFEKYKEKIPTISYFFASPYDSDRHMARDILNKLESNPEEFDNEKTYKEIELNLNAVKISSEKQQTQWSGYLLTTKDLIRICWESGSIVGPSRGSGGGFILLYLLDIMQINPTREEAALKYWRFLNPERVSPLD